jgi:HK97 family phage major capsid protein
LQLKEIRTKRETYMNTARSILQRSESEGRALTADESKDYDGLMAKIKALGDTLDRAGQFGELRAQIEKPVVSGPVVQPESNGGMSYTPRYVNPGEVRAFKGNEAIAEQPYHGPGLGAYIRGIVTGKWASQELRALAEGSTPGSYLVPTPLAGYIIDLVRNQAQVLRAGAMTIPFDSQTFKIGRQTGDVSAAWKAENAAITFSDAAFDTVTFTAQMLVAGQKMSIELFEDAPNIDAIVTQSITKSLALALDSAALYGSGSSSQPRGVRNTTNVTVTDLGTNGYTLIDYSKFSAGIAALMGNNFTGPFGVMYSPRTAGELDALQDTLHQPLRQPDLVAAARKFVTTQCPINLTKGSVSTSSDAFIGQWEHCLIGMRTGMVMEISRVAADSGGSAFTNAQVWIRAYLRADVQLAHPQAFVVLNGIL